jgi:hypothetical protein
MATKKERQARISAAAAGVQKAHKELARAGAELLLAIGATEDEIEAAAEMLADCLNDEPAIRTHDGLSHWGAMLAQQVLDDREYAEEERLEAEEVQQAKERQAHSQTPVPDNDNS